MSFNSMTDNYKNCQSYDNAKNIYINRSKSHDSIKTNFTTVNTRFK